MNKYQKDNGDATTSDDPRRMLWFSSNCTYWTDDWMKLKTFGDMPDQPRSGVPCCPHCGSPGLQAEAAMWLRSAQVHESNGHPAYFAMVQWQKERCAKTVTQREMIYQAFAAGYNAATKERP